MSGHNSIFSIITVLAIFMGIYFIALAVYEIKNWIRKIMEKKGKRS